jgi:hypothetical protein
MGEKKKKLADEDAWKAWLEFQKPSFKGTLKFREDHTLPDNQMLTKKNAIEAAAKRFERNGAEKSTWTDMRPGDPARLANKAGPSQWKAHVFRGKQQLTVLVNMKVITVIVEPLNSKQYQLLRSQQKKVCRLVRNPITKREQWVHCNTKERPEEWCIMGDWDPFKGSALLHHYGPASDMPEDHNFIDKYLVWWCEFDDVKHRFVRPLKPIRPEKKS